MEAETFPWEDYQHLPPGPVLFLSKLMDLACDNNILSACPDWRSHVPFGLADTPNGWLSHKVPAITCFPPHTTYSDYLAEQTDQSVSFSSIWNYAFHTNSTALGNISNPTAFATLFVLTYLLRLIKRKFLPIFSAYGRDLGRKTHGPAWEKTNEERIFKFGEYVYRLHFHSMISLYGVWYFWGKEWWDPSKGGTTHLFQGFPYDQQVEPGMAWYYLVQAAYNMDALITICETSFLFKLRSPIVFPGKDSVSLKFQSPIGVGWSPTCRGDFQEMFVHHIITNILIVASSYLHLTRIGSMVFLVHDLSDVPIDVSKLANFVKWKKTTIVSFITLLVTWIVTRLIIFPFYIFRSVLYESDLVLLTKESKSGVGVDVLQYCCYKFIFVALIGALLALHVVWFIILVRILLVLALKGETQDLSEHKGGEEDHASGMVADGKKEQ